VNFRNNQEALKLIEIVYSGMLRRSNMGQQGSPGIQFLRIQ
jgi:hypothetical protein